MATDNKIYSIPIDSQPAMVGESVATYSAQPSPEQIVLTIPHGIEAEPLRKKVNAYYHAVLHEYAIEQEVKNNLEEWLLCTGMYSGPNLCWDNAPFRRLQSMDRFALSLIDKVRDNFPDYTQRHIGWLIRKLQS